MSKTSNIQSELSDKIIIICGMGRSGTSLVANFFQNVGFSMGDRVPEADQHNKHGYYEDLDFINFHESILLRYGFNYYATAVEQLVLTEDEREQARKLVASRSSYSAWGWKDPRTAFLLDFWDQELDQARFVFLYRHPIEVFLSQLRSHTWVDTPVTIIESWEAYNKRILNYFSSHREKCILCNIHGLIKNIKLFEQILHERFDLSLTLSRQIFESTSMHSLKMTEPLQDIFSRYCPETKKLYDALEEYADIPFQNPAEADNNDFADLIEYTCDVLNDTLIKQAKEHKQLAVQHQELKELYHQLTKRYADYKHSIETSETFRIARMMQESFLFKTLKRITGR